MGNLIKQAAAHLNPLNAALQRSAGSNFLVKTFDPVGSASYQVGQGEAPLRSAGDPVNLLHPTIAQKQAAAFAAATPQRAAAAALDASNQSIAALRARRRAGRALTAGAPTGTAPLSSTQAYGITTLGG
ncbi:MAG: hypothetical protein RL684_1983 [Pseudomonadota bacterium]